MRFRTFALKILPVVLVFGAVWLLMIAYWRTSGSDTPGWGAIALYLLVLPLAIIAGYLLLKKGIDVAKRRGDASDAPAGADGDAGSASNKRDPQDDLTLQVLAGALRLPVGEDAGAVTDALREGARPDLHAQLLDHRGMPAFAAEAEAGDPEAVDTPWDVLDDDLADNLHLAHRRALALAAQVLGELGEPLDALAPLDDDQDQRGTAVEPEAVQVFLLLPDLWPKGAREAAALWLQRHAEQAELAQRPLQFRAMAMSDAGQVLTLIERLRVRMNEQPGALPRLLLACDSHLDEDTVHRWSTSGRLLVGGHDEGQVPGEGAAGLLLGAPPVEPDADAGGEKKAPAEDAPNEDESPEDADPPPPRLHAIASHKPEGAPAPGKRRRDSALTGLIGKALAMAQVQPDAIQCVVSDGDSRPSRSAELVAALHATLPDLDCVEDGLHVGIGNGHCGFAGVLAVVALAAHAVGEDNTPVLVATLADDTHRAAFVIAPPGEGDAGDDSDADSEQAEAA